MAAENMNIYPLSVCFIREATVMFLSLFCFDD